MENLLAICESIREMKAECRITRKIPSEIQILIKSPQDEDFIKAHSDVIKSLTFSDDLLMMTDPAEFEAEDFLALSTAGHLCSFGIKTLDRNSEKAENLVNLKKFKKLESELMNLMNAVNNVGYQKNASEKVKKKHKEKVSLSSESGDKRNQLGLFNFTHNLKFTLKISCMLFEKA